MTLEQLQYPTGKYATKNQASIEEIKDAIDVLHHFPTWIETIIANMDEVQLQTAYRDGGWNTNQVVHHCADSHLNCLTRLKLALTEENPTIKPYDEAAWATCVDYNLAINISTTLLHCVHKKIVAIFSNLSETQWQRTYYHPENKETYTLIGLLTLYAWHCKHHFAHIKGVKDRNGWR
jgi:DinB superfamily